MSRRTHTIGTRRSDHFTVRRLRKYVTVDADYSPALDPQQSAVARAVVFHAARRMIHAGRTSPFWFAHGVGTVHVPRHGKRQLPWLAKAEALFAGDESGGTIYIARGPLADADLLEQAFRGVPAGDYAAADRYLALPEGLIAE